MDIREPLSVSSAFASGTGLPELPDDDGAPEDDLGLLPDAEPLEAVAEELPKPPVSGCGPSSVGEASRRSAPGGSAPSPTRWRSRQRLEARCEVAAVQRQQCGHAARWSASNESGSCTWRRMRLRKSERSEGAIPIQSSGPLRLFREIVPPSASSPYRATNARAETPRSRSGGTQGRPIPSARALRHSLHDDPIRPSEVRRTSRRCRSVSRASASVGTSRR
jgi:hypothetical protein